MIQAPAFFDVNFVRRLPLSGKAGRAFLLALMWCVAAQGFAQQPASATTRPVRQPDEPLLITFALTPERTQALSDSLADHQYRMYDPARKHTIDYGTLGNLGSAARPMLFETPDLLGFSVGVNAFDLYMLQPEQLGFFRNSRTFSDVFFSQGRNQFETNLNARFARTFEGGTNFSLDYRTLNNLGQYRYQRAKHNSLATGLWVPIGKRYQAFFIFTRSVIRHQDNGGIVTDTVFGNGQFDGPIAAEVRLPRELAATRLDDQSLQLTQHLLLAGKDASGKRSLRLSHTIDWSQQKYKFYDQGSVTDGLGNDAAFFEPYFLVDERGLRHFIQVDQVKNAATLNTFKTKTPGKPSDLLAVGITHSYFTVNQEPRNFRFSNLFLTGQLAITPSERFAFTAEGALGLLDNIGEYQLKGGLSLGLGKAGFLQAGLRSQIRPPGLLYDQLYVSKRQIWNQDFAKLVENTLYATYSLPLIGLSATARAHLVNNYVYFDQNALAAQTTTALQVNQLIITENFKLGRVHFDNTIALQQPNREDVFRLPKWFTKNSVYFSGKVFKRRMQLDAGADFRINAEFRPEGYHPLSWQFYLQDELTQKPYPWVDLFLSFKVQSFRGFVRYENCNTWFNKSEVFYQTARHALPFGALRFGIAWRFLDDNVQSEQDGQKNGGANNPANSPFAPRGSN
ncbi:MAG: hypothetical protein J0M29_18095 [Chitinophagales bacterium]|nr:hypothetical protein [Chitinophagales bacterium]